MSAGADGGEAADPAREQALDWLLELRSDTPGPSRQHDFAAWLAASEAHRRAFARAERAWRVTGALAPAPSAGSPHGVLARRRRFRRRAAVAVAAAAAIALVALAPTLRVALLADHRTGTGEIRQVALPDGSTADLDADSAIAVDFAHGRAVDLLEGRAYFSVSADAARPFTVRADPAEVTVTGTGFDVDLGSDAATIAVAAGTVEVSVAGAPSVRLAPGDRLSVDRATGTAMRDRVPARHVAAWRGGRLVVDGITLGRLAEELARHHVGGIVVADDDLAQRRVTGVFDLADPNAALRAAVLPHGGRVTRLTPFLLLVSGP